MRIEGQAHDFSGVAFKRGETLAVVGVPDLGSLVKRTGGYTVAEGIVEGQTVEDVLMACQSEQFSAGLGIPQLACPIVAAGDEPESVECTCRRPC